MAFNRGVAGVAIESDRGLRLSETAGTEVWGMGAWQRAGSRLRGGFTLVELLVVIASIAVLLALLFPAMSSIREQAKLVQCVSNLRQFGTAVYAYAAGEGGWIPRAIDGTDGNGNNGELYDSGLWRAMKRYVNLNTTTTKGSITTLYCPTQGQSDDSGFGRSKSYALNWYLMTWVNNPSFSYHRVSGVRRPNKIYLARDFFCRRGGGSMSLGDSPWLSDHKRQAIYNMVMVDGHVESVDQIKHYNGGGVGNVLFTDYTHVRGYGNTDPTYFAPKKDSCLICGQ